MLCRMTYNVDTRYISEVLKTTEDVRCWIMCSVRIRENTPGDTMTLPLDLRRLMYRSQRLSHSTHRKVQQLIVEEDNPGLDLAIKQTLRDCGLRASAWTTLANTQHRWMQMKTQESSVQTSQEIHYNILEGELIVDGMPVGRLPKEYLCNYLYKRVFGSQILDVVLADMPGMNFMTAQFVHGYKVYFAMRDGRLAIRTRKGQNALGLLLQDYFDGDIPANMIDEYTHWLDLSSKQIEFRPLDLPRSSSRTCWRLQYQVNSGSYLFKGERRLVDIRSHTFVVVMKVFKS